MYHGCKTMSKEIGDDDAIDIIIKSKIRSTFWTSVTLLIFKANLERRTNAQNVGNWTGYLDVILISKSSQSLQLSSLCYELSSCWKFWQVRNLRLLFHLSVCCLPKFRRNLQVCSSDGLSVCLSVCLSRLRLLAGCRSHRLTNHHQNWPRHVTRWGLETHLLCRSKVK